eukprot:8525421-Karenia_brevis.AAC.1
MKTRGSKLEKIKSRWEYGFFVGVNRRSNEFMISTVDGIVKSRSIKRIPKEEKWSNDNLRWVKWAPWKRHEGDEEADGEVPEGVKDEDREERKESQNETGDKEKVVYVETKSKVPR